MEERIRAIDQRMLGILDGIQQFFTLLGRSMLFVFSKPFYWRDLLRQMDDIGVGSLAPILLTGFFIGMVLALQTAVQLRLVGAEGLMGNLMGATIIREAGPVMAALMVAGRVSSGIAAELGAMRVSEQIDALQTFGTDPIRKLVTPRILAAIIMLPLITLMSDAVALVGGMIIANLKADIPPDVFLFGVMDSMTRKGFIFHYFPAVLLMSIVKPMTFGLIIALTGCYYGLNTTGGGEGVGLAATRAMVSSFILILVSDYFLTELLLKFFNILRGYYGIL
jgi:phospholipid/cholesterol/gamma-HCH transport system permease protein